MVAVAVAAVACEFNHATQIMPNSNTQHKLHIPQLMVTAAIW